MRQPVFVNLPCKNLPASKACFEALGYSFNPQFTGEAAACPVLGESVYAMLFAGESAKGFTARPLVDAKAATGGTVPRQPVDHGFVYDQSFEDLDGHIRELCYMSGTPPQA